MKIYVDLIFLLNIGLDFILLMSLSLLLERNVSLKRIFLGSLIGGISTLFLIINISSSTLFLIKFLLGLLMCIVTFNYRDLKYTLNNVFYLYVISFIVGGGLYLIKDYGYYNYIILILGFIVICYMYVVKMRKYQNTYTNYAKVDIYFHGKLYKLNGYLDTGNKLYDQYKKRPIILVYKKINYCLDEVIFVPYISLNSESVVKCLKVDKIVVNNHVFNNYLIGLSDKMFQIDGVDCILHSKMKGYL